MRDSEVIGPRKGSQLTRGFYGATRMLPAAVAILSLLHFVDGLRLMALEIPDLVISGEETTLTCVFDLEEDTLYSIKWYRDDLEFFRYVPSDKPPNQFFPLQGLDIDLGRSSNGTVYINNVDVTTAGTYKCEISADAPSFQTVAAEKMLTVTVFLFPVLNDSARIPDHSLLAASFTWILICHFAVW